MQLSQLKTGQSQLIAENSMHLPTYYIHQNYRRWWGELLYQELSNNFAS